MTRSVLVSRMCEMLNNKYRNRLLYWLPVILWAFLIFAFSEMSTLPSAHVTWQEFIIKNLPIFLNTVYLLLYCSELLLVQTLIKRRLLNTHLSFRFFTELAMNSIKASLPEGPQHFVMLVLIQLEQGCRYISCGESYLSITNRISYS